jgi:hypothetical protein
VFARWVLTVGSKLKAHCSVEVPYVSQEVHDKCLSNREISLEGSVTHRIGSCVIIIIIIITIIIIIIIIIIYF